MGVDDADAKILADIMVDQEMTGNQFSPVGALPGKHSRLFADITGKKEEVVQEKTSMKLIKGNGRIAPVITAEYLDSVVSAAKEKGIYALGIYDSTYNDFFDVFCRRVAAQDCICIIAENGGPQGVVPYGGKTDVTGTNPIAYGIPTNGLPIVFDASTSAHAFGRVMQAKLNNEALPDNAYVDKNGNVTTDPDKVHAVLPFGRFKGYGINLLVEVLSGALVSGRSGLEQPTNSQRYIGTLMIVIDPSAFGDIATFKNSTTKLTEDILRVEPIDTLCPVRVPGFRGGEQKARFEKHGYIDIDDDEWKRFTEVLGQL